MTFEGIKERLLCTPGEMARERLLQDADKSGKLTGVELAELSALCAMAWA